MSVFDLFIALDGNGLNGFEGFAGVARLRCDPDAGRFEPEVRFYSGVTGGHALQIAPSGRIGFLGNLSQTLLFFDPRTLREIRRLSTLGFSPPDVSYASQTHVVWLDDATFITALGPDFLRFRLDDLSHPERLGAHGVTLPHAIKRSPSGRFLFYGAMDHDHKGYANQVGVFDLETGTARLVKLPATVWHIGVHPRADVFYAPTQRCAPQGTEFVEYTIAHFKNYLFEIDGETARVSRHLSIPKDMPGSLTSDVVVTDDHVLYNACASGVVVRVDLRTLSSLEYVDELPGALDTLRRIPVAFANVLETFSRANVPANTHVLLKALRATRGSAIDGSYGLQLSPDRRFLLSAHRGLNEVIVYDYPSLVERTRVRFPSIRRYFPEQFGRLSDPRLGFHHSALSRDDDLSIFGPVIERVTDVTFAGHTIAMRDARRMFKVIVGGGAALVSVGSLFALSCGSDPPSGGGVAAAGEGGGAPDAFPSEGPPFADSGPDAGSSDDGATHDAYDAEASFPPII